MSDSLRVAITASFTAQPMGPVLSSWLDLLGLRANLDWAPYGQVFQALLEHDGTLRRNRGGLGVVLVRRSDLIPDPTAASEITQGLAAALRGCADATGSPIVVAVCPSSPLDDAESADADARLVAELRTRGGVDVIAPGDVANLYPTSTLFDTYAEHEGNVPYTEEYFAALATLLARRIRVAKREPKKLILIDCDDTLWGGIVGEVGVDGVVLDEPRLALQRFLLEQRDQGVLLAVVSKNNERDALAVFEQRPEMVLRSEHLTTWRINWNAKSENIHDIARELSLGVDSFVLLDDDAFVCAEARDRCGGLVAIQLPDDPTTLPRFVRHLWPLDRGFVTAEDRQRAEAYRVEAQREHARCEMSHADFLASLGLEAMVLAMEDAHVARVAQLTVRTNQFNATGVRRSEAEVRGLRAQGLECSVVHVRDRFGDYGLTGAVIYQIDHATLNVESLLLSCRVLGRGVEQRVMAELAAIARGRGARELSMPYIPTAKNAPYAAFFTALPAASFEDHANGQRARLDVEAASNLRVATDAVEPTTPEKAAAANTPAAAPESFDPRQVAIELWHVDAIRARFTRSGDAGGDTSDSVAAAFCEVLDVPAVGQDDDFFNLGGDSIAALRVLTRIRDRFGVEIALHELFQMEPTVRVLSAEVTARLQSTSASTRPKYVPTTETRTRATVPQQYFFYLDRDDHDPTSYYSTAVMTLEGDLDVQLLARSYRELVTHHSTFRTAFDEVDGVLYQTVLPVDDVPLPALDVVDRSSLSREQWKSEFESLAAELTSRGYDLSCGRGMIHACLVRLGEKSHGLVLVLHHIATDGGSNLTFRKQLFGGYQRLREGAASAVPQDAPLQHIDFAHAREQWASTPAGRAEQEMWAKRLEGAAGLLLEGDFPRGPIDARRDAVPLGLTADQSHPPESFKLPPDVYAAVNAAARAARTTPFAVFVAGFAWLLHERSGQRDIAIQTTYTPRPHDPALETMIGCLTTWTLLRVDLGGAPTFHELIARARGVVEAAHQSGPPHDFYRLVKHDKRRAVMNYMPIQPANLSAFDFAVASVPWRFPPWKRPWDLHVTLVDDSTAASLVWTGFEKLFRRETVLALLERYVEILRHAADA